MVKEKEAAPASGARPAGGVRRVRALLVRRDSPDGAVLARIRSLIAQANSAGGPPPADPLQDVPEQGRRQQPEVVSVEGEENLVKEEEVPRESEVESTTRSDEGDAGEEEEEEEFAPLVKLRQYDGGDGFAVISVLTLKGASLSSELFRLLEAEEGLDVVFANQYRTETKLSHTLQVRFPLDYDLDALKQKLCAWARV